MTHRKISLYDTTLRDGAQTEGVKFTAHDKALIAHKLDDLGVDYVEGGWPGANEDDTRFFANPPKLKRAKLSAFGMTRKPGVAVETDSVMQTLRDCKASVVCIVGKSWRVQVVDVMGWDGDENLAMIEESVAYLRQHKDEVLFDAEHYFDGYKSDPDYALACLAAAQRGGAAWLVLCDTNGGCLPHEIDAVVTGTCAWFAAQGLPEPQLGVHCHNDSGTAVANSLAAVRAGAGQVQGTINGLGERCGNANLITIIPALELKLGLATGVGVEGLTRLTDASRLLDARLNRQSNRYQPYVGYSAFAHKAGLHAAVVNKSSAGYEHVPPEAVGNRRRVLASNQAGKSNVLRKLSEMGLVEAEGSDLVNIVYGALKAQEDKGYSYEDADASLELLARRAIGDLPEFFKIQEFAVRDEHDFIRSEQERMRIRAYVIFTIGDTLREEIASGEGPVDGLTKALMKGLRAVYAAIDRMSLADFRVRILNGDAATAATTCVTIDFRADDGTEWTTVGVSNDLIAASFEAVCDGARWWLARQRSAER